MSVGKVIQQDTNLRHLNKEGLSYSRWQNLKCSSILRCNTIEIITAEYIYQRNVNTVDSL